MADEQETAQHHAAPEQSGGDCVRPLLGWRGALLVVAVIVTLAVAINIPSTPVGDRMTLLAIGSALTGAALIGYARASGAWWFWGVFGFVPLLGLVMTMLGVGGERLLVKRGLSDPLYLVGLAIVLSTLLGIWALVFGAG